MEDKKAMKLAETDSQNIKDTSIGYAVNFVMDYGNGRQLTISGTLPLGASLPVINAELDKLRKATNRQQALITIRNRQATLMANEKMLAVTKRALTEYEKEMDSIIGEMSKAPNANHTTSKGQRESMKQQGMAFKQQKQKEMLELQGEIEISEVIIAGAQKEIDAIDSEA